jgi:hypothetical protein
MKFLDVPQSGSYAGNTHSHNRAGQYRRNRRSPVQPVGTGRRAFIRGNLTAASQGWNALTGAERASWSSFADSHPITDSLGQSIKLTGQQMYVRVGASLLNVAQSLPTDPPSDLDSGSLSGVAITAAAGTPALSVAYTVSPTTGYLLIAFSPQVSPGRSYNSRYWQATYLAGSTASPYDGLSAFNGEFGTLIAGQRIFCRVTPISSDGWNGTPTIVSGIVSA